MYQRHFITFEAFLEVARRNEQYFEQCIECRTIRFTQAVTSEMAKFLRPCLEEFRNWAPIKSELEAQEIFISHGSCKCCVRERLMELARRRQSNQGLHSCFGQAVDGHCSEDGTNGHGKCIYYGSCVVDRQELAEWENWRENHPKREWNARDEQAENVAKNVIEELSRREETYYASFVG